jgi:WXG100 family type VII secretion target
MAMEGMDVEQVSGALNTITNAVSELETLISSTQGAYNTIEAHWQGQDAHQFQSQWPTFQTALNQAHNNLSQLQTHLHTNLQAQQNASNTY